MGEGTKSEISGSITTRRQGLQRSDEVLTPVTSERQS